jgi:hypothetical protein
MSIDKKWIIRRGDGEVEVDKDSGEVVVFENRESAENGAPMVAGTVEPFLDYICQKNNPNNEPVGHYTGRCMKCHSQNLWCDTTAYGCNDCGAIFGTG